jgi:hypothetical protein
VLRYVEKKDIPIRGVALINEADVLGWIGEEPET